MTSAKITKSYNKVEVKHLSELLGTHGAPLWMIFWYWSFILLLRTQSSGTVAACTLGRNAHTKQYSLRSYAERLGTLQAHSRNWVHTVQFHRTVLPKSTENVGVFSCKCKTFEANLGQHYEVVFRIKSKETIKAFQLLSKIRVFCIRRHSNWNPKGNYLNLCFLVQIFCIPFSFKTLGHESCLYLKVKKEKGIGLPFLLDLLLSPVSVSRKPTFIRVNLPTKWINKGFLCHLEARWADSIF